MKYSLRKYGSWASNKIYAHRPYSSAIHGSDDLMKAPKWKPKRKTGQSSPKRKRKRRMTRRERISAAIRTLLALSANARLTESHLRDAEIKLGLPMIRLHLDKPTPFSTNKGRMARIFKALGTQR